MEAIIVAVVIAVLIIMVLSASIKIVPQAHATIVERFGRYQRTLNAGIAIIIPFVDRVKPRIDLREQVISFPPQPVITEDNLVVGIDSVIYFQVTDPKAVSYEVANFMMAIEQLTVTTLRNVIGSMDLEKTLTSRDSINAALRGVLDDATGRWGIRVNRVELKAIDPPQSVQQSMEKQMRAERDKRAAILTAEGEKQSAILMAEGARSAAILRAEGSARAAVLNAEGESEAILKVVEAIRNADPDSRVLAYQYIQSLPEIAAGESNKIWMLPTELSGPMAHLVEALRPSQLPPTQA
jgi:regulator of protease activity HflC (stomatin/prohibitin superfamily)